MDSASAPDIATDELPTEAEYRPLCVWAVVALLLGLVSALALITPALAVFPLAAIVVSIVALSRISAAPQPMGGRPLAVAGLCLALLFMGWGVAGHYYYSARVARMAREFADDWLKILATGDQLRAFALHSAREGRQDPYSIKPPPAIDPRDAELAIADFFGNPAIKEFLAAGPTVQFRFEEIASWTRDNTAEYVVLKYAFDGKSGPVSIWLTVRRTFANTSRKVDWELYTTRHTPPDG